MSDHPTNAKELTRQFFDSLWLEQRLMDSCVPETGMKLYGKSFKTPIMTAALSHLGTFHPDAPNGMVDYAKGAALAGRCTGTAWEKKMSLRRLWQPEQQPSVL